MKIPLGDIDIATTALPDDVVRRARAAGIKSVPTGIEHGTVTLVVEGHPFEVTTLREDTETYGRKAKVAFGRDWVRDAERRDFTINGLSVDADHVVHDHVGGLDDIATRRVRFIGDAHQRIELLPQWYLGLYSKYVCLIVDQIREHEGGENLVERQSAHRVSQPIAV